ncbi:BMP family ABC transporter substrate-binding protein [Bacillus sp. ISL-35]|uniref:BMP family lipoprotein n=1 Tax=Bacillus sp. ISL-35 TaxID=2819122 RepID=UPI001BE979FC|nr:BMP family ABC transporter substrate-binding protein [Bacillus sp. ISL-35]MBT2679152.1 BMP family ABC transporter substrate-binding protein [Bacillus sp. ISL-35]MBT2702765.1 BMP family ABC transporter substrate-binding protein [Chryseobacterium sp. ISL-80]
MKRIMYMLFIAVLLAGGLAGCANTELKANERVKIGIMLSDVGLGDQSFSDAAFAGLTKARDELDIQFDYRELQEVGSYEKGFTELVEDGNDLVIGLGFMVLEDLEKVAKKYPEQQFILVDSVSEMENITSIVFKEEQGSFLAGAVAGMATKSKVVGFVGGADVPLIRKFKSGFEQGVKAVKPDAEVKVAYSEDFGNADLGGKIAAGMIDDGADVLYAAAGFTGVGVLKEAQARKKFAIGVDSDQYFFAEKAIITSMLKNVDIALYEAVKEFQAGKKLQSRQIELGINEKGVGLAPIRVIKLTPDQEKTLKDLEEKLSTNEVSIQLD